MRRQQPPVTVLNWWQIETCGCRFDGVTFCRLCTERIKYQEENKDPQQGCPGPQQLRQEIPHVCSYLGESFMKHFSSALLYVCGFEVLTMFVSPVAQELHTAFRSFYTQQLLLLFYNLL